VMGLDNGDAGGEGFDGVEAKGFGVAGGDGEDGEVLKVGDFFFPGKVLSEGVVVVEFGEVEFVNLLVDEFLVVGEGGACDAELGFGGDAVVGVEIDEGFDEDVHAFEVGETGEEADGGCLGRSVSGGKAFEVDAVGDADDLFVGKLHLRSHQLGEGVAGSDEFLNAAGGLAHEFPDLGFPGFDEGVEEGVFALEGAVDGDVGPGFDGGCEADLHGGGEEDGVGLFFVDDPVDEVFEFFGEGTFLTLECGEGHLADFFAGSHAAFLGFGDFAEEGLAIEDFVEPFGDVAEEGVFELEVGVDAAEEDGLVFVGGGFVEDMGQVHGEHDGVMSLCPEFVDQGVVFHADAAVVTSGSWTNEEEFHVVKIGRIGWIGQI